MSVSISLEARTLTLADGTSATFPIDPFARRLLMSGEDELDFLLSRADDIARFEAAHGSPAAGPA